MNTSVSSFYYHKIGQANDLADDWLSGKNPLGKPATVIFFGSATAEEIRKGLMLKQDGRSYSSESIAQAQNFVLTPDRDWNTTCIVVVDKKVRFLRPAGPIETRPPEPTDDFSLDSTRKIMPVERIIEDRDLSDVPLKLTNMNSNRWLGSGTYRQIREEKNRGNLKAIYSVLSKTWEDHWYRDTKPIALLECLSSIELETLIAKIFEAYDCFVPAYRGGTVRYVDLFVYNYTGGSTPLNGGQSHRRFRLTSTSSGWDVRWGSDPKDQQFSDRPTMVG